MTFFLFQCALLFVLVWVKTHFVLVVNIMVIIIIKPVVWLLLVQ